MPAKKILSESISKLQTAKHPLEQYSKLERMNLSLKLSTSEIREVFGELQGDIEKGKGGKALTIIRALMVTSSSAQVISWIRRFGVFRCSKYKYRDKQLLEIVGDLLENSGLYKIPSDAFDYLKSVKNLLSLSKSLRSERSEIVKSLIENRREAPKTFLANIDVIFKYGLPGDRLLDSDDIRSYSPEEIIEAASCLFFIFHSEIGFSAENFGNIDESCLKETLYEELLVKAAKLCEFQNAEVFLDAFPYRVEICGDVVRLSAIDPLLEKSIRLGYIQTDMQMAIRHRQLIERCSQDSDGVSIASFAKNCFDKLGERIVYLVEKPISRYVFKLPDVPQLIEPFSRNHLFIEDVSSVEMLATEDYIDPNTVAQALISDNITVIDVLKIQRFFGFINVCFSNAFSKHPIAERANVQLRSCVAVFRKEAILRFFGMLLGEDKAENILNLLTINLTTAKYIDLQYTPIIKFGGRYMFSPVVLSGSNLVRNILCHQDRRLTLKNMFDPMQSELANALQDAGFLVATEIDVGTKKKQLETDIIAYRDGFLFILECKNSFHPCNVYELRTSYDYIVYAASQLEKRKAILLDVKKQMAIFEKLGWNVSPSTEVRTCIAIGNRVFNGYQCSGHPVRQVHEMLNLLRVGQVVIGDEPLRLWKGQRFSIEDFLAHLSGDTVVADFLHLMQPFERQVKIGSSTLSCSTYMLDTQELAQRAKSRYQAIESVM